MCINYSTFLKDFLNMSNFNSAVINCKYNKATNITYQPNIHRTIKRNNLAIKIYNKFNGIISHYLGNHCITLIEENGMLYLYDPTKITVLQIDFDQARLITGDGKISLMTLSSLIHVNDLEEFDLIETLAGYRKESPYKRKEIIIQTEENIEHFENNHQLINNFYDQSNELIKKSVKVFKNN